MRRCYLPPLRFAACALLALAAHGTRASDATVYIYTSTLNRFASAISPIPAITGRYKFTIGSGILKTTICDSAYSIRLSSLSFNIKSNEVTADANVSGSWCGVNFNGDLDASGNVSYHSSDSTIRFSFNSASVQPYFSVFGHKVWLPVHVNIAPTLNIPKMHIGVAYVGYETGAGPRAFTMRPSNVSLTKHSGYLQLQTDVGFY